MATGVPLGWSSAANDIPTSVSAETGGAGDDIALTLASGDLVEIQAKRRLKDSPDLWNSLLALCQRVHHDASFHGVLVVGPMTSVTIRNQLARDLVRIGQSRTDDLSPLALKLLDRLSTVGLPNSICSRVRIQTVHVLEQDNASALAAIAHLANITSKPSEAWERLTAEGQRLIKLRGRHDASSVAAIIPLMSSRTAGQSGPSVVATQLLDWTLGTTGSFTIPAVTHTFSLDTDWIKLKAYGNDMSDEAPKTLEDALAHYHGSPSQTRARRDRSTFDAESLGYFIRHCVIVAGPGMGKSQLLRRIARLLARKREPSLLVRLRPLAERMQAGETFIEAVLRLALDASSFSPRDVEAIGMQNLTLLLDGLDEAGAGQEEIAKAASALAASFPRCRIVFTTRPIGYETSLLRTWRHYELEPIESSTAKRGVEALVAAAGGRDNPIITKATAAAVKRLEYKRGSSFAAKSPLMIALLSSLALNEVVAAGSTEGLYEQLFNLLQRMTGQSWGGQQAAPAILNAFLEHLGWELIAQPLADTERLLETCAQGLSKELGEPLLKARVICEQALTFWERSGIVERVRFKMSETFTFVHKTFGEYAAARHLIHQNSDERMKFLTTSEPQQQWHQVMVFASAMGRGEELVQLALARVGQDSDDISRVLQWAKYSKDPLTPALTATVWQESWNVISAAHSGFALSTGLDLLSALPNLTDQPACSDMHRSHEQWWTALVGWACFVQKNQAVLDFSSLLNFMDTYIENADTRSISGGFDLYDPARELWDRLLLSATREAVRRGLGPDEQRLIERLTTSSTSRSMGFIGEFTDILQKAGVEVKLPVQKNLLSDYFTSDFFENDRRDRLAILGAIAEGSPEQPTPSGPMLHLSAFWYGTSLMQLEISAATLATGTPGEDEAATIVKWAARATAYDYSQLLAEAQTKILALMSDPTAMSSELLLAVDAPVVWRKFNEVNAASVITKALLHPSRWVVYLAVNLAENLLTPADAGDLVAEVLVKAEGIGTAGAAHLAIHFLGADVARRLLVERLKQPLNAGAQYLFPYLAELWISALDKHMVEILKPALVFGTRTAKASLMLARAWQGERRSELALLLREAYDYWLVNEEPYPTGNDSIPESPRGAILSLLLEEATVGNDVLYAAAKDPRSEVSKPAFDALLKQLSTVESARNELLRRLISGEELSALLTACLRAHTPFSEADIEAVTCLLASESPQNRYAAAGILHPQYLKPTEIVSWAEKLLSDPYQRLRDKGHEILAVQRNGERSL